MKKMVFTILFLLPIALQAQEERKYIRQGYKAYNENDYNEAEVGFRKAEELSEDSYVARYNTTTAIYQQDKLEESAKRFSELLAEAPTKADEAALLHNMGNVFLKEQKYQEAVDAYKKSLRIHPDDEETRYNLAYALEKLREQQQQQQQNQDQNQQGDNKENKEDKENKQQNKDQQDQNEQQDKQNQQHQENKQNDEQDQQGQPQKQQLNKDEAERLLQAILQKEKDVKEKVDKKKAAAVKVKTDKDW